MSINNSLSNLYVEKATSEHPIAFWMLNEQIDFLTQTVNNENFDWTVTNGSIENILNNEIFFLNRPFKDSLSTLINGTYLVSEEETVDITITSKDILTNFYEDDGTFAISFYMYKFATAKEISFGFSYEDVDEVIAPYLETFNIENLNNNQWSFFSHTFNIPDDMALDNKNINIIITLKFVDAGNQESTYDFVINGLSVGQLSENFNKTSLGIYKNNLLTLNSIEQINFPDEIKCLKAFPYGASNKNAYYLAAENKIFSKNFGIPLVFGSSNITKIIPNTTDSETIYPSIIFPGYGFLNKNGQYNDYSIEAWVKINPSNLNPKKIFGPLFSEDGLYVDSTHLTLKIGKYFGSYYVGEWFRPMLIHIRLSQNVANVLINGEQVISFIVDQNQLIFPTEYDENLNNQDWLGWYAYEDISQIEIDNFSIYSYNIPIQVAKRRWVWGQGVSPPEQTNSSLNSITAFSDYSFANYNANYNYPDFANWKQAFFNNLNIGKKIISLPEYQLPEFKLSNLTQDELFNNIQDTFVTGDTYITLNSAEDNDFIYFDKLNILNEPVRSIYGIFETDGEEVEKTLIKLTNKINNNYIEIVLNDLEVSYKFVINGSSTTFYVAEISPGNKFPAGLDLLKLIQTNSVFNLILSNQSIVDVKIAGNGTSKFNGNIFKIGFDSAFNHNKIANIYNEDGTIKYSLTDDLYNHTANYTLVAVNKYGLYFPDIAVSGYWQDYMPLSYFSKEIEDFEGNKNYELDYIQYDFDYPQPTSIIEDIDVSDWNYLDLEIEYAFPIPRPYNILNNELYTGWQDYEEMSNNVVRLRHYNTENNQIRSYISFQKITEGANKNILEFNNIVKPLVYEVINPSATTFNWETSIFETTTGSIIYPPTRKFSTNKPVDFNDYAIVYHLDFKSDGILHNPITFKKLQLSSNVLNRTDFTTIGSKFGVPIFYYLKNGIYYDFKTRNPITITKNSTPHLYLDRASGWTIKGALYPDVDRGIAIPINFTKSDNVEVSSIQLWIKHDDSDFIEDPILIMSIQHALGIYDFYIQGEASQSRAKIYVINRDTLEPVNTVNFYINGKNVLYPFIEKEEWAVLGLEFPDTLNFDKITGLITLNGPLTYNNISYNLATNVERNEILQTNTWSQIDSLNWDDYLTENWTWRTIKIIDSQKIYVINPQAIYEKYTGADRIIVDTGSTNGLSIDPETIKFYKEVSWSENIKTPV